MKKIIAMLLVLFLCRGFAACGGGVEQESQNEPSEAQTAGELVAIEETASDGSKTISYREGSADGREVRRVEQRSDGTNWESVYDENGALFSEKWTLADGSYSEFRYENFELVYSLYQYPDGSSNWSCYENGRETLAASKNSDGSYTEHTYDENGNCVSIRTTGADGFCSEERFENGVPVSLIVQNADGSYSEQKFENGNCVFFASKDADGSYTEQTLDENGNLTYYRTTKADGSYTEQRYENGIMVSYIYHDPTTKQYDEEQYYENEKYRYFKYQTADSTLEKRFDEEGYVTYHYSSETSGEETTTVECIADETGKLVKYIENGKVYTDAGTLASVAAMFGFRK